MDEKKDCAGWNDLDELGESKLLRLGESEVVRTPRTHRSMRQLLALKQAKRSKPRLNKEVEP
jgi:hypothetical protein